MTRTHHHHHHHKRLLTYSEGQVEAVGFSLFCKAAGPIKAVGKDPAGHSFHFFAQRQSGLYGAAPAYRIRAALASGGRCGLPHMPNEIATPARAGPCL